MKPLTVSRKGEVFLGQDGISAESLPLEFQKCFPDLSPKYIDPVSLMAGIAARRALGEGGAQGSDSAVIIGTAFGAIDSTVEFDAQALKSGPNAVNPMDFPNTVANAAGSRIGIWLQLKGPNITLTNGETSFIDALGFAWEGYNSELFQDCLVGAVEKVPDFLKPLAPAENPSAAIREGSCLLFASPQQDGPALFEITDYFSLQLKPDFSVPKPFQERLECLWDGVEWLGFPLGTPLESRIPSDLTRDILDPSVLEMGLKGVQSLNRFPFADATHGLLGAFSKAERKFSFVRLNKKRSR
jgi:hypothetical protein